MSGKWDSVVAYETAVRVVDVIREITIHDYETDQPVQLAAGPYRLKRAQLGVGHEPDEFLLLVDNTKQGQPEVVWKHHPFVKFAS